MTLLMQKFKKINKVLLLPVIIIFFGCSSESGTTNEGPTAS
jgi:hypothetical protein